MYESPSATYTSWPVAEMVFIQRMASHNSSGRGWPDEASIRQVSDDSAHEGATPEGAPTDRSIRIYLSERATLKAVRVNGGFHILVGDDTEIRGVTPEHMRSLVGSVMDAFVPADMASRILNGWSSRRARRRAGSGERREEWTIDSEESEEKDSPAKSTEQPG